MQQISRRMRDINELQTKREIKEKIERRECTLLV